MPPTSPAGPGKLGCTDIADLASEFLERDLDECTTSAVTAHLQQCHACLRLYAELAMIIHAMHRLGPSKGLTVSRLAGAKG